MMAVSLEARLDTARLRAVLHQAHRRAAERGTPVLAALVVPVLARDPLAFFVRGAAVEGGERVLFLHPSHRQAISGVGAAWVLRTADDGRFQDSARAWRGLVAEACIDDTAAAEHAGPLLLGGYSFDPRRPATEAWQGYPDGALVLPRYLLTVERGTAWVTLSAVVAPDDDPDRELARLTRGYEGLLEERSSGSEELEREDDHAEPRVEDVLPAARWQAIVSAAVRRLRAGDLEKVVLARACRVQGRRPFSVARALARLRVAYPSCFIFAVAHGDTCFLGATPERLVELREGAVQAMSLAGSIGRGATPEEDQVLGARLLASTKDHAEHAVVVRALAEALAGVCTAVSSPATPMLLKVHNVQHLLTTVTGTASPGTTVLDLVGRLHPTPAVGGHPRATALQLIRDTEELDRGWYAGPLGWVDARGDGEFVVALRSALVRGSEALVYAGCGIVADSDPVAEYAESRLKLRPMLAALGGREQ